MNVIVTPVVHPMKSTNGELVNIPECIGEFVVQDHHDPEKDGWAAAVCCRHVLRKHTGGFDVEDTFFIVPDVETHLDAVNKVLAHYQDDNPPVKVFIDLVRLGSVYRLPFESNDYQAYLEENKLTIYQ